MNTEIPAILNKTPVKNYNRLDPLLALRGFACLMVVVMHCAPPRNAITLRGFDLSWLTFSHGMVAVWIFFVLSGYLMGKAFYSERYATDVSGFLNFIRNRALRILPLYYFAVLILTLFVYPSWLKMENWGYLLRVCTFTYDLSVQIQHGLAYNGVFWSLSTEVQFYLLVPFIYSLLRYRLTKPSKIILAVTGIFIIIFLTRYSFWTTLRAEINGNSAYMFKYWFSPLLTNIDLFLCGFLINPWLKQQSYSNSDNLPKFNQKYIALILIVILYLATAYHFYHEELWNAPEREGKGIITSTTVLLLPFITAITTSFFIMAFESSAYNDFTKNEKLSLNTILKNPLRALEVLGHLSYGIYIWHQPILEKVGGIFTSNIPLEAFYIRLTATVVLSTVLATVTYYLVEIPTAKWKIYRR